MGEKKKNEDVLSQEARDKIYREEMDKRKRLFAKKLYAIFGESGISLYIILSSVMFGIGIPIYVVGINIYLFEEAFNLSPLGVTSIISFVSIMMFLIWMLFGSLTVEILKKQRSNKNKKNQKKKWWEI